MGEIDESLVSVAKSSATSPAEYVGGDWLYMRELSAGQACFEHKEKYQISKTDSQTEFERILDDHARRTPFVVTVYDNLDDKLVWPTDRSLPTSTRVIDSQTEQHAMTDHHDGSPRSYTYFLTTTIEICAKAPTFLASTRYLAVTRFKKDEPSLYLWRIMGAPTPAALEAVNAQPDAAPATESTDAGPAVATLPSQRHVDHHPEETNVAQGTYPIRDALVATGSFPTLVRVIDHASAWDDFEITDGYTIFAPTEEAFAKLAPSRLKSFLEGRSSDIVMAKVIWRAHVVPTKLTSAQVAKSQRVNTRRGPKWIREEDGQLTIGGAVIGKPTVTANGVIYPIDRVIQ